MHPDLSSHLHTTECNKLIEELQKCHETNKFAKFIGSCNAIDRAVTVCLKKERVQNAALNRARARERQQRIKERVKFLDEDNKS